MITICLSEANFEYDIHSLVKAFYVGEEVKVSADREKIRVLEQECMPLFHMEICYCRHDQLRLSDRAEKIQSDAIELEWYNQIDPNSGGIRCFRITQVRSFPGGHLLVFVQ